MPRRTLWVGGAGDRILAIGERVQAGGRITESLRVGAIDLAPRRQQGRRTSSGTQALHQHGAGLRARASNQRRCAPTFRQVPGTCGRGRWW